MWTLSQAAMWEYVFTEHFEKNFDTIGKFCFLVIYYISSDFSQYAGKKE